MANKNLTINDLGKMIKEGFDEADKRFDGMERRLKNLEDGQVEIKLKLDNVAYRFEVIELQHRVALLEKKLNSLAKK